MEGGEYILCNVWPFQKHYSSIGAVCVKKGTNEVDAEKRRKSSRGAEAGSVKARRKCQLFPTGFFFRITDLW